MGYPPCFVKATRKICALQSLCGHEKAANQAALQEVLLSPIDETT
jgi:hypothetical protein